MIIEFVGLPGSGKTTTSREVRNLLRQAGYQFAAKAHQRTRWDDFRRSAGFLWFRIREFRLVLQIFLYALSVRPFKLRRMKGAQQLLFRTYYYRELAPREGLVILCQGVVQAAWSIGVFGQEPVGAKSERLLERIFAKQRPTAFVQFRTSPRVAAERIVARRDPNNRLDNIPQPEAERALAENADRLERLVVCATKATGSPWLTVSGDGPPGASAGEIVAFIAQTFGSQSWKESTVEVTVF